MFATCLTGTIYRAACQDCWSTERSEPARLHSATARLFVIADSLLHCLYTAGHFKVNASCCEMHDIGRHFRLESQGRNPALAFAAILMVFGAVASFSQRRTDGLITKSTGRVVRYGLPCLRRQPSLPGSPKVSVCRPQSAKLAALPYCPGIIS